MMKLVFLINKPYLYGFKSNVKNIIIKKGFDIHMIETLLYNYKENENIVNFRTKAIFNLYNLRIPDWSFFEVPDISYDNIAYFSIPLNIKKDVKDIFSIFKKDIKQITEFILDSISIFNNTFNNILAKLGIIFFSLFQGINLYSYLIHKYIGTVVSLEDNFFSTMNSTVFSEGSFGYIPNDIICNFDLSTYFRINSEQFAQFERTLIILGKDSRLCYIEGCSAPIYIESQLHVAVVELIVKEQAILKYSTLQNWYRGNYLGEGGLYNFTTKRGLCLTSAQLEWIQVEIGSAITWKYPSTLLLGDFSISEFWSITYLSNLQLADTGCKMIHIGNNTKSKIISKGISLNNSINIYRGLVEVKPKAFYAYSYTECDSIMIGKHTQIITIPYLIIFNQTSFIHQEAKISKINEEFLFFLLQRGISNISAYSLILTGFCLDISIKLPLEISVEIPLLINLRTKEFFV